jgi:hypothetical protein
MDQPDEIGFHLFLGRIRTHKFLLSIISPVFRKMFLGSLPVKTDEEVSESSLRELDILAVLRNRGVYPGCEFHPGSWVKKIPVPGSGSAAKNLSIFNPKLFPSSQKNYLGSSSRIRIFKHRILDTDPQHCILETHVRGRPRSSVADGGSGAF